MKVGDRMNKRISYLRGKANKLTTSPGVYLMKDRAGKIIYIGKAKVLKNRVISYFRESANHDNKVRKMVSNVHDFDFIVTGSEFEALLLECSMIKQYRPKYNILLKDDKGYSYIKISNEEYPRITAEKNKSDKNATYLGPYASSYAVKQAVDEANSIFKLPTCTRRFPQEFGKGRPCLNFHIKRCSGICIGNTTSEEYKKVIDDAVKYMQGGSEESVKRLTAEMGDASENLDFERAAKIRDQISAIQRIADTQQVIGDNSKSFDLIALSTNANMASIAVIMYRNGKLVDKDDFFLGDAYKQSQLRADFITNYYSGKDDIPRRILVDDDVDDMELIEQFLREKSGHAVNIHIPQRGEGLKQIMLAKANASEYLSLKVGRTGKEITALEELSTLLGLPTTPEYIEAYDVSNLGETAVVGGMVVFKNGRPLKSDYKRFTIKDVVGQDDYASMREMLSRRFKRYLDSDESFSRLPDLILVDGGKGHVSAVEPMLRKMGIDVPVFGMVKDDRHRTRAIAHSGEEISITSFRSAFSLVTRIQDEAHRFAISFQRKRHNKRTYELELTKVRGIGDKKAHMLIKEFKTKAALKKATVEELRKAAKVGKEVAKELHDFIAENF